MASEVEICNLALSNIRAAGINSLNEASLQAQQCKLKYPIVRDMVLSQANWGFSRKLAPLALLTDTVFNWKYAYQYPSDCLFINRLILNYELFVAGVNRPVDILSTNAPDLNKQVAYEVFNIDGNRVIASNEVDLRIDYRSRVTNPNLFSTASIMATSWLLASELALPIVGAEAGRALRSDALNMYQSYLASAAAETNNQRYSAPLDSEYITVRN